MTANLRTTPFRHSQALATNLASDSDPPLARPSRFSQQRGSATAGGRFKAAFPITARVIFHPLPTLLAAGVAGMILLPLSVHYAISAWLFGLAAVAIGRDRAFLDYVLMSPNALASRGPIIGTGIGAAYIASAIESSYDEHLVTIQIVGGFWLICQWLANAVILARLPRLTVPFENTRFTNEVLRPLAVIGYILITLEVLRLVVGVITGIHDRGIHGAAAAAQGFGIWTFFGLFPRLTVTSYFLAPAIWRLGTPIGKAFAAGAMALLFLVGLTTGSRGMFITPLFFLLTGVYFFIPLRRVRFEYYLALTLAIVAPLVLIMDTYRNTAAFQESRGSDITERLQIFFDTAFAPAADATEDEVARYRRRSFGTQLLGVADRIIYEHTPQDIEHAGFENVSRIAWVFVPKFIKRDKPYLQDGNDIVVAYTGLRFTRSAATISFSADMYRRFGWLGVAIGVPIASIISALFYRWVYSVLIVRNATLGILLLMIALSIFNFGMWGTLLSSSFEWLYNLPKHLIFIAMLLVAARALTGTKNAGGLLAYSAS